MPQPRYERAECNFHNEKNGVAPRVGQGSLKPFVARECRGNALTAHIPYLKKKKMCYYRAFHPTLICVMRAKMQSNLIITKWHRSQKYLPYIQCKYVRRYRSVLCLKMQAYDGPAKECPVDSHGQLPSCLADARHGSINNRSAPPRRLNCAISVIARDLYVCLPVRASQAGAATRLFGRGGDRTCIQTPPLWLSV